MIRNYTELAQLHTFKERFDYLRLDGAVGMETFGFDRYLNQIFYHLPEWKSSRRFVIVRDEGCDLGVPGYEIRGRVIVHHMNPITKEDILERNPDLFNPEYLITVADNPTHKAIHYGDESLLPTGPAERRPNDTCPWKQ